MEKKEGEFSEEGGRRKEEGEMFIPEEGEFSEEGGRRKEVIGLPLATEGTQEGEMFGDEDGGRRRKVESTGREPVGDGVMPMEERDRSEVRGLRPVAIRMISASTVSC